MAVTETRTRGIHRAWWVAAVTMLALVAAAVTDSMERDSHLSIAA